VRVVEWNDSGCGAWRRAGGWGDNEFVAPSMIPVGRQTVFG